LVANFTAVGGKLYRSWWQTLPQLVANFTAVGGKAFFLEAVFHKTKRGKKKI